MCKFIKSYDYKYDLSFFGSYEKIHSNRSKLLKKVDDKFNLVIYTKDINKISEELKQICYKIEAILDEEN